MDNILGSVIKSTPLFSFHTIVDEDVGLIRYVMDKYYDKSIFDFSVVNKLSTIDLINLLYYRPIANPLHMFLTDLTKKDFVDECYREFMETKEDEIIEYSVYTEIPYLIKMFKDTSEIIPTIFYYTDFQHTVLQTIEDIHDIDMISIENISSPYSEYYLRRLVEVYLLDNIHNATLYFASTDINVYQLENMTEDVEAIRQLHNRINIFDLYKSDLVYKEKFYAESDGNSEGEE